MRSNIAGFERKTSKRSNASRKGEVERIAAQLVHAYQPLLLGAPREF
jgi:hypothetical protein